MNPTPGPVIRYARAVDAGLLAELGARTFSETFAADNSAEDMAVYLASSFGPALQAAELADPDSIFLIAEVDGFAIRRLCEAQVRRPAGWRHRRETNRVGAVIRCSGMAWSRRRRSVDASL